jgi:cellulose synthase/poly-beta-1,6-N-acetylglucosamine synthase-like glycosyltransferase
MLLVPYVIFGPLLWALLAIGMALSYTRMSRLRRPIRPLPANPPRLTVLIPAKDEGDAVRECLDRALALDYPNCSVIAINDRSSDNTGAIFDEYAAKHPGKLTVEHIRELPAGWLGKCNALASVEAHVDSEWILFVDSDVKVEPDSLSAVLALAVERDYDAVSIMTRLETHTFWERLILPLCATSVGVMTLMLYTNDDNHKSRAFANGQFLLIRRAAYESVGGHAAVRDNITEDVALVRLLKQQGHRVRIFLGRDFASTRMHATLRQMFHGWARIFSGVSNRRPWAILAAMGFVLSGIAAHVAAFYGIYVIAATHSPYWLVAAATHLFLLWGILTTAYRWAGNPERNALLFPIAGPMMLAIYAYALRTCRTGKIAWRGTSYHNPGASAPLKAHV